MANIDKKVEGVIATLESDLKVLEKESGDALSQFNDTVNKLESINQRIDARVELANTHINRLTNLKANLCGRKNANNKVKDKIAEFLNA